MNYYVYAYLDKDEIIETEYCGIYFKHRPIYIGKGKNKRMFEHLRDRKRIKSMFYNKLNKMINEDKNPIIVKLKEFDDEREALDFEALLIRGIKNIKNDGFLYNTTEGGTGISGYKFTDEVKERMREIAIKNKSHLYFPKQSGENHPLWGKKHKPETIEKISKANSGRKQSAEEIEKRVSKLRGISLSDEHKNKISESNKDLKRSEETKKRISDSKKGTTAWNKGMIQDIILQLDESGEVLKEWKSLIDLEKEGYQKSNIINVCAGKRKSHKGFKWLYKSDFF